MFNWQNRSYFENSNIIGTINQATYIGYGISFDHVSLITAGNCSMEGFVDTGGNYTYAISMFNVQNQEIFGTLVMNGNITSCTSDYNCAGVYDFNNTLESTGNIKIYGKSPVYGIIFNGNLSWSNFQNVYLHGIGNIGVNFGGFKDFTNISKFDVGGYSTQNNTDSTGVLFDGFPFSMLAEDVYIKGISEWNYGINIQCVLLFGNTINASNATLEGESNNAVDIYHDISTSIETNCSLTIRGYIESPNLLIVQGSGNVKFMSGGMAAIVAINTDSGCEFSNGFITTNLFTINTLESSKNILCGYFNSPNVYVGNSIAVECIPPNNELHFNSTDLRLSSLDGPFSVKLNSDIITLEDDVSIL